MKLYLCREITSRQDAYALLAYAVRLHRGLDALPTIAREEQGKPYFPDLPELHFNLSHSGSFALCALDDQPVGTDIEVIRPHHPRLSQRICSEDELLWLSNQVNHIPALCQLWTAKEALAKYHGTGLRVPLRSLRVPLPPASAQDGLLFHRLNTPEYCLCVCGHSAPSPLVLVDREEICR